jgi:hypothetical protein
MFERARAAWQIDGQLDLVPIAKWSVARTLRSLGRVDEALAMQMAQKEEVDASGTSDGYVSEEIGECLLLLGRSESDLAASSADDGMRLPFSSSRPNRECTADGSAGRFGQTSVRPVYIY